MGFERLKDSPGTMDKRSLTERDICTKFILPAVKRAGWDEMVQVREEVYFTKGRIIVRGKLVTRGKAKKADFVLYYKPNIPIALIEAKDNNHRVGHGIQQGLDYAATLDIPFVFSSNGDGFLFHDRGTRLMMGHRVSAPLAAQPGHVRRQHGVVLGVHQYEPAQTGCRLHPGQQRTVVGARVSGLGIGHERLESCRSLVPLPFHLVERDRRERAPQPEVDDSLAARHFPLLPVQFHRGSRRIRERMLENPGDPSGCCGHRAGVKVLALGVPGVLEVAVQVDRPGHDHQASGIDDLVRLAEHPVIVAERGNAAPGDDHMCREDPVRGRDRAVGDNPGQLSVHGQIPSSPDNSEIIA